MSKKVKKKEYVKPQFKDEFYRTDYSATTADKFTELWGNVYNRIPCIECKVNPVQIKREIFDIHEPRFGILRKKYCLHCWLEKVTLKPDLTHIK